MQPIQHVLSGVVAEIIRRAPMSADKVAFAWQVAVGPTIARATTIAIGDGGVLDVKVSTEAWRRELKRSAQVILERLAELLGEGVIARLKIAGSHPEVRVHRRRRVPRRRAGSRRGTASDKVAANRKAPQARKASRAKK